MRVPDDMQKCVMFVRYRDSDGTIRLAGTAFLVGVEVKDIGISFVYCVTARHVVAKIHQNSADQTVILRINKKDGSVQEVETPYHHWQYHPDDSTVDAAVLAWAPPIDTYDIGLVHIKGAVTSELIERENIGIGDEVFIAGLFSNHYGEQRNLPIVRTGNVALMSEERVQSSIFGKMEAYLIESRSIGGLSGSPVFIQKSPVKVSNGKILVNTAEHVVFWLGLIHGHWDIKPTLAASDEVVDSVPEAEKVNMGIAIVVPAVKIAEVINQPLFADQRERECKRLREEQNLTVAHYDNKFRLRRILHKPANQTKRYPTKLKTLTALLARQSVSKRSMIAGMVSGLRSSTISQKMRFASASSGVFRRPTPRKLDFGSRQ